MKNTLDVIFLVPSHFVLQLPLNVNIDPRSHYDVRMGSRFVNLEILMPFPIYT